jgi:3-mercaptopyruvate sulfurtransferase SseA
MSTPPSMNFILDSIALAVLVGLGAIAPSSNLAAPRSPHVAEVALSLFVPERATPADIKARRTKGEDILVVDVRAKESFDAEHIEGAISNPWRDMEKGHTLLPKDRLLLLYCT